MILLQRTQILIFTHRSIELSRCGVVWLQLSLTFINLHRLAEWLVVWLFDWFNDFVSSDWLEVNLRLKLLAVQ